jgi:hypothetical protein
MKPISTLCGQNAELLNVKAGCTLVFKGLKLCVGHIIEMKSLVKRTRRAKGVGKPKLRWLDSDE